MLHRVFLSYRQSSIEDIVGGNVHERKIRFFADTRQGGDSVGVGGPGFAAPLGGFGVIHCGVGGGVNDRTV